MTWNLADPVADGDDREAWLEARRYMVTSTDVAKAVVPSGWRAVVMAKLYNLDRRDNVYFAHGRERETEIAQRAFTEYGVAPNRFLFARDGLGATPDGINPASPELGEYKTSTKPMPATFPRVYRDQVFMAQHVLGAERTLVGWERHQNGVPVEIRPTWRWIDRDQERIDELLKTADELADFLANERLTLAY
jgi:hypothetical protein